MNLLIIMIIGIIILFLIIFLTIRFSSHTKKCRRAGFGGYEDFGGGW
jgi:hypothetical protein